MSSGTDVQPIPLPSIKCSLKEVLSDRASHSSDLNSYFPPLESTRGDSNSFLDSIHKDSSSSSENYEITSSISSSFASKHDLTSCLSSDNINFDPSIFDKHISPVASDLESVNSTDSDDSLADNKLEDPSIDI